MPNEATPSLSDSTEELLSLTEQLSERIVQLEQANSQLQAQLASVLAAEHTPLLHYGEGTWQRTLNARSIKVLFLAEQTVRNTIPPVSEYAIMADETFLTNYLPPEQAMQEYNQARAAWMAALEPPTRQS